MDGIQIEIKGPEGEELEIVLRAFASDEDYQASIAEEMARFGIVEEVAPVKDDSDGKAEEP